MTAYSFLLNCQTFSLSLLCKSELSNGKRLQRICHQSIATELLKSAGRDFGMAAVFNNNLNTHTHTQVNHRKCEQVKSHMLGGFLLVPKDVEAGYEQRCTLLCRKCREKHEALCLPMLSLSAFREWPHQPRPPTMTGTGEPYMAQKKTQGLKELYTLYGLIRGSRPMWLPFQICGAGVGVEKGQENQQKLGTTSLFEESLRLGYRNSFSPGATFPSEKPFHSNSGLDQRRKVGREMNVHFRFVQ